MSLYLCVHRPIHRYVCDWCAPAFGEAYKSPSPPWTLSTCQNQGCELFPRYPWWVLLHHEAITLESFREGSLALANKHMHMPPLTYSVLSNLHAVMRFFIIWHSKIIFLMYERAWLVFTFKDFVFITSFFFFLLEPTHFSNFNGDMTAVLRYESTLCVKVDILLSSLKNRKSKWNTIKNVIYYHIVPSFKPSKLFFQQSAYVLHNFIYIYNINIYWILNECLELSFKHPQAYELFVKMFVKRNTDGSETSWSKINKRWSESLARVFQL